MISYYLIYISNEKYSSPIVLQAASFTIKHNLFTSLVPMAYTKREIVLIYQEESMIYLLLTALVIGLLVTLIMRIINSL
jgi:hypothetical protein